MANLSGVILSENRTQTVRTWIAWKSSEPEGLSIRKRGQTDEIARGYYFFMQSSTMPTPIAFGPHSTIDAAIETQKKFLNRLVAWRP